MAKTHDYEFLDENGAHSILKSIIKYITDKIDELSKKLEPVVFDVDDDGNLIYSDGSLYTFTIDDDGYLNWR